MRPPTARAIIPALLPPLSLAQKVPRASIPGGGGALSRLLVLLDGLDVELDLDLVADQEATRLQRDVPGQSEVLPVDRRGRLEADDLLAPGVHALADELRVEHDRTGDAADRQLAADPGTVGALRLDL